MSIGNDPMEAGVQAVSAVNGEPPHPNEATEVEGRSYAAMMATMFQGAFSDNAFRIVLMVMVLVHASTVLGPEASQAEINSLGARYQMIIGLAWSLPWIIAVGVAGWLSDRFSKAHVARGTKVMEVGIMGLACLMFAMGSIWLGIFLMFLMSLQSALFSPSKYGILPEMMPGNRLAWGNGVMQGLTFAAILLGTTMGPMFYGYLQETIPDSLGWMGAVLVGFAAIGLVTSMGIRVKPPANPSEPLKLNPFRMLSIYGREILAHRGIFWGIVGMLVWWSAAIMLQSAAVMVSKNVLGVDDRWVGVAMLPIVIGMGVGCFLTSYLSKNRIELGLVPAGAVGMFVTAIILWFVMPLPDQLAMISADHREDLLILIPALMGIIGLFAGMVIVPLEAYVVYSSDPKVRGGIWATSNLVIAFGWIGGSILYELLVGLRGSPGDAFFVGSLLILAMAVGLCWLFPRIPLRLIIVLFFRVRYRVRVKGLENLPAEGGGLLVPNHQSYLDGILLASIIDRPVRFVITRRIYDAWFAYHFSRATKSIPIESISSPRDLIRALREAREEIESGGMVCMFPEGQLTRIGQMLPFRRGIERIMHDSGAPVIPAAIDGAFDTPYARPWGKPTWRRMLRLRRMPINVSIGKPMPADTPLWRIRQAVVDQMTEAFQFRHEDGDFLHRLAIRELRRRPLERAYSDHASGGAIPNLKLLSGVAILGKKLRPHWENENAVGILLPPSLGSVIVNLATLAAGKKAVNLNYTVSPAILKEICKNAEVRVILTSRLFMEKIELKLPEDCEVIYLDDVRKTIGSLDKIAGLLYGLLLPIRTLERRLGRREEGTIDDIATLIYSSGSTGIPKGVMLTHWNILSNVWGAGQVVNLDRATSRFLGILPFFHSFGYMATLWLPLLRGVGVSYYPNPLDARAVGETVMNDQVTHLFATPTFLSAYLRRLEPGMLGSVTFLLTGAEKLRPALVKAFTERFGIAPREGYGCTETSPVISLNGTDFRGPGFFQCGSRQGTVGQPIPGVTIRVRDPENNEELPPEKPGMLYVYGPNVMLGYYKQKDKDAEALHDRWYKTGDIVSVSEDGFITITDRLARFSKMGGEMVPHLRVEEELQRHASADEQVFAVTGLPDEAKGERLAVLYTLNEKEAEKAFRAMKEDKDGLPSLWQPRWQDFIHVESLPLLGSGKLDLKKLKAIAEQKLEKKE